MDPVVVSSTFQWLSGYQWAALLLLSDTVLFLCLVDKILFHSLSFPISIGLLLVRHLGLLVEIELSIFLRTKHTLVGLKIVSWCLTFRSE